MQTEINNNSNTTPEGEEKLLCCCCMSPNESSAYFCANCGAPLGWFSTLGPFESAFSEGYIVRRATENPHSPIILIGVWLIFFPLITIGFGLISPGIDLSICNPLLGGILILISVAILYKITRNYYKFVKNKRTADHPSEN